MRNNEDYFAYLFSSFITLILVGLSITFSWFFLEVPLTEEQYAQCEQIAKETLENNMVDYEDVPDDLTVSLINNSRAIVSTNDFNRRGRVVAEKRHNGEIIIERFDDFLFCVIRAVFKGMVIVALLSLIVSL